MIEQCTHSPQIKGTIWVPAPSLYMRKKYGYAYAEAVTFNRFFKNKGIGIKMLVPDKRVTVTPAPVSVLLNENIECYE